jgi:hypothetical protein
MGTGNGDRNGSVMSEMAAGITHQSNGFPKKGLSKHRNILM